MERKCIQKNNSVEIPIEFFIVSKRIHWIYGNRLSSIILGEMIDENSKFGHDGLNQNYVARKQWIIHSSMKWSLHFSCRINHSPVDTMGRQDKFLADLNATEPLNRIWTYFSRFHRQLYSMGEREKFCSSNLRSISNDSERIRNFGRSLIEPKQCSKTFDSSRFSRNWKWSTSDCRTNKSLIRVRLALSSNRRRNQKTFHCSSEFSSSFCSESEEK